MEIKELIAEIKANIEKTVNIKSIFGDVKKVDNVSIIPVASVRFQGGGGGGFGEMDAKKKEMPEPLEEAETEKEGAKKGRSSKGGGLGMKVDASPVGYIEIKDSNARFVEIVDKTKIILKGMKLAGIAFVLLALRGLISKRK
jgi:uncharacterized spore protein YtfJ